MPLSSARSPSPLAPGVATGFGEVKMSAPSNARFSSVVEDLQPRRLLPHACETLYAFEDHARECDLCNDPYRVHQRGARLCVVGHSLARRVEDMIFSKHNGAVVYSHIAGSDQHLVRIELPPDCGQVVSLLRAVERSLRHPNAPRIVSQDSHYYVAPRPVARHTSLRAPRAASPPRRRPDARPSQDPRRSGLLHHHTAQASPTASSPRRPIPPPAPDAPNNTNFRHATVEDDDDDISSIAPAVPSSPPSSTRSTTHAASTLRRSDTLPTRDSTGPRLPPSASRPRAQASPRSPQMPSAPQRLPRNTTSTAMPEAPEPPVRTDRATPTEFAYTTQLREPSSSAYRQPARSGVPPIRRRSVILPFR